MSGQIALSFYGESDEELLDKIGEYLLARGVGDGAEVESEDPVEEAIEEVVDEVVDDDDDDDDDDALKVTFAEVKKAVQVAKKAHGLEFIEAVLELFDADASTTVNKQVSALDEDDWPDFVLTLEAGPDDSEDEEAVSVEPAEVKEAIRAYAKANGQPAARKILNKHGVKSIPAIDKTDVEVLAALYSDLTE